jgi:hypothetical protein
MWGPPQPVLLSPSVECGLNESGLATLSETLKPVMQDIRQQLRVACQPLDVALQGLEAWEVALLTAGMTCCLCWIWQLLRKARLRIMDAGGMLPCFFSAVRGLPFVKRRIQQQMAAAKQKLVASQRSTPSNPITKLPDKGLEPAAVLKELGRRQREAGDTLVRETEGHLTFIWVPVAALRAIDVGRRYMRSCQRATKAPHLFPRRG